VKLRYRLLISYFILIALPLILLGGLFYRTSLNVVREQAQENVYTIVQKNNEVLDTRLEHIDQGSRALFVDKDLFRIFEELDPSQDDQLLEADRKIKVILSKYFTLNDDVYSPQLWTTYFTFVGSRESMVGVPSKSVIYQTTVENEGKMVWTPTYDFIEMYNQPWLSSADIEYRYMFSASRLMNLSHLDSSTIRTLDANVERPVLAFLFKADVFRSLFESSIPSGAQFMVLSPSDTVIAHTDPKRITKQFGEEWTHSLHEIGSGTKRMKLYGENVIVFFDRSKITGWLSIVIIPESILIGDLVPTILTSTLILTSILSILAVVLAYFFVGYITAPIKKLLVAMRLVSEGDFGMQVESKSNDEFGILFRKFNSMNNRIRILVNENYEIKLKEKEAEIHALNMQMNPHFLYNTLNVMNWAAIENGQIELSKMLVSLSNMLHYTTRRDWEAVHLSEEMEWMKNYFYIMLTRFEEKFIVRYELEAALYDYKVPRLLFQPFVENAILHGFDQNEHGGIITISGRIIDGVRYYEIMDNGRGMTEEMIERILRHESASIGISNTLARIRLQFGQASDIQIHSKPGEGTTITIILPLFNQD
jgi:two-component system sensor histidine kinase YesM